MLDIIFGKIRLLFRNPIVIFVYGILSKWYIMVMVSAAVVAFWVFKGLISTGILEAAEQTVSAALQDTKSVARYCVPKIKDFGDFWACLQDPPEYEPTEEEIQLEKGVSDLLNIDNYNQKNDPYSQ